MLILVVAFLGAMYVGKIFFPQDFVMLVENERLVAIGQFIDGHPLVYELCSFITAFATYWLYSCAVSKRKSLTWKECLVIVGIIVLVRLSAFIDENLSTHISITSFMVLPLIVKGSPKIAVIVYGVHGLSQILSLSIRNLPMYFSNEISFLSMLIMSGDMYLWLILFYLLFNIEKEKENG